MIKLLPGTVLEFKDGMQDNAFSYIEPVFALTKGLSLSQVRDITGLESSTIQNWVKRGWVARPVEKRYQKMHLIRIILINSIRGAIMLERIPKIMEYINGIVEDESDDIITDSELYNKFCKIIYECDKAKTVDADEIKNIISSVLCDYTGPFEDSKQRLQNALLIMVLAFLSARLKEETDNAFAKISE